MYAVLIEYAQGHSELTYQTLDKLIEKYGEIKFNENGVAWPKPGVTIYIEK